MNVIHSKSSSLRHYSNFNETLRVSAEKKMPSHLINQDIIATPIK